MASTLLTVGFVLSCLSSVENDELAEAEARWKAFTAAMTAGVSADYNFGVAVTLVGDLDSDGTPEWAIGDPADHEEELGAIWIVSGSSMGVHSRITEDLEGFGESLAGGFDLNDDGSPDLVASFADVEGNYFVRAIDGRTKLPIWDGWDRNVGAHDPVYVVLSDSGRPTHRKALNRQTFGAPAMLGVPDVNSDGVSDLVVTCAGGVDAIDSRIACLSGVDGNLIWQRSTPLHVGFEISIGDDFDGDGFADVLLGAENWSDRRAGVNLGSVLAVSSRDGRELWQSSDSLGRASYGSSVALHVDLDGDEVRDVLVGLGTEYNRQNSVEIISGATGVFLRALRLDESLIPEFDVYKKVRPGPDEFVLPGFGHYVLSANGEIVASSIGDFAYPYLFASDGLEPFTTCSQNGDSGSGSRIFNLGDLTGDSFDEIVVVDIDLHGPIRNFVAVLSRSSEGIYEFIPDGRGWANPKLLMERLTAKSKPGGASLVD